jgi:adenylylsulfate kinase
MQGPVQTLQPRMLRLPSAACGFDILHVRRMKPLTDPNDSNPPAGVTVWFTGLSGAGKSTLCNAVAAELTHRGYRVEVLDGDEVRRQISRDLGFSKEDRDENIRRIGELAATRTREGSIVLVAAISPYRAARERVRGRIGRLLEVFVDAPLAVCEQRDPKGLYRKARLGELSHLTGLDDPYEPPLAPEVRCLTSEESIQVSSQKVISALIGFLRQEMERS